MEILPIINANYDNKTNFKGVQNKGLNVVQQVLPEAGKVAKLGAVAVLAYLGVNTASKTTQSNLDDFQIRELTQEEFNKKCEEIKCAQKEAYAEWEELKANYDKNEINYSEWFFPTFAFIDTGELTHWNVQLLDYMLKNSETYKYNYNDLAKDIVELGNDNNQKTAEVILKMLKMPYLFPQEYNTNKHFGLYRGMYKENTADTKMQILNMIEENKTDYDRAQIHNLRDMLTWIETEDGLRVAKKLIEKPDILKAWIHENAFRYFSNEKEDADIKIAYMDKINSKPELLEDERFIKYIEDTFNNVTDKETLEFACKLWDNPILFESESFRKVVKSMIYEYPQYDNDIDKATREVMNKIVDAAAKKPELFKNEKFRNDFGQLLFVRKNDEWIMLDDRPIEIGKRNLFLIEHGYYDDKWAD